MSAAGIFSDINQPNVHALEMVTFRRESILKILEIDQIHNEKLKIRCGINTGGPIIAGVLGMEKPTFERLGPAINIAQQMEHNDVPMQVQITGVVYELSYGCQFQIKERQPLETSKGKIHTYLVSP
jgi:class 3 adenylate cyclase